MTTEIIPCQTCQSLVLRYVRHRWHALFQKHVSMLSAFRLSSANDAFHFRPYHKAGHMIVVRRQPRMPELFRYFQPGQPFLSGKNRFQCTIAFTVKFLGYLFPAFGVCLIGSFYTPGRELQHPTNIFCRHQMPCRAHYMRS